MIEINVPRHYIVRTAGRTIVMARFLTEEDAVAYIEMTDASFGFVISESVKAKILESFQDYLNDRDENDRAAAIAKLTDREKTLLGI